MIAVGTCGYAYDDWRGVFYPARLPKKDFLSCYVRHFRCLELNSSYYAIPSAFADGMAAFEQVVEGFEFPVER